MKNKLWLAAGLALTLCGCSRKTPEPEEPAFEVESEPADMSAYRWLEGETADFQEITWAESIRFFKEGGTGILYYGYIDCPFCQRAVPLLNEAARETGTTVYYVNVYGKGHSADIDEYYALMECIDSIIGHDDKGEPDFKVPEVIGVRNGEITGHHLSLVDDFHPSYETEQMSDEQQAKLKQIYLDIIADTFE